MNQMVAMTGSIAHEINQPISAILANANAGLRWLGRTTPDVNETRAVLQAIVREAKRMDNIVSGIRTIFKTGAPAGVLVDLNELIREILAVVHAEHWNSQIEVHTSLDENLPFVSADRVQLQQVILNLLTNAIDAMETVIDRERRLRVLSELKGDDSILLRSRIVASVSPQEISTVSSIPSSPPSPTAWEWVSQYVGRSSKLMAED
jgi:C4-dicarboxylate-specific signal transduction histidine kinase